MIVKESKEIFEFVPFLVGVKDGPGKQPKSFCDSWCSSLSNTIFSNTTFNPPLPRQAAQLEVSIREAVVGLVGFLCFIHNERRAAGAMPHLHLHPRNRFPAPSSTIPLHAHSRGTELQR
jgi:hypothetical protein